MNQWMWCLLVGLVGCSTSANNANNTNNTNNPPADGLEGLRVEHFQGDALASPITEVACTLDDGTETTCYQIVIKGAPVDHEVGPFCPRSITDGPELGGIWPESGKMYDVDGAFITGLADLYDDTWQLYDPATGEVRVTDTQESCEAAARPDVDEMYQNHCVECSLDYVGGGVESTLLIPKAPVARDATAEIGGMNKVGVALNGVSFDPPAPVDAIKAARTIAAFDDCGGHVNLVAGYHYHAATGCSHQIESEDGHAPMIGYALDGYAIHAMVGTDGAEPSDLDTCRGHEDATRGYHYHAASAGENMFIGCFRGHTVGTTGDAGPGGMMSGGVEPILCEDVPAGMPCCGDDVCDGPETAQNCAVDCS